ncbi:MAG: NAD(P)/FAD-dependent oxidoreductase [Leptolyngbyaceae cyanobacterium MO_188.B28]|nr:NAD(P)/FAD-dependent oxidoreductase [Leptolyngbyaceae cyanobacterium MO_188.B28]
MQRRRRVVIIGSGFGGMQAAQSLAGAEVEVVLIDRNNYHTFAPLLYQVAAAGLEPAQIAYPIRTILRRARNVHFLMAEVRRINFEARLVETDDAAISYDYLLLATGSQTQYLGTPGAAEHAFPMRNLNEAIALRNQVLTCFEQAMREPDPIRRQQLLTFVIVGGGPTGVELAGAFLELIRGPFRKDYPLLDVRQAQIVLVQSARRLLSDLPCQLGEYTQRKLCRLGVKVHLQTRVSQVNPTTVRLQDGREISAATVIWTAGLTAAMPPASRDLSTLKKKKLAVQPTLQLLDHPDVYAIGDLAAVESRGKALTGVAPEALQQGVAVARNIKRQLRGREPKSFTYFNKGRLAIIGCYTGAGKIGPFAFSGFLAWFMWLGVHLVYLPGFRNRVVVLISWLHAYLLGDRSIRLILSTRGVVQPIQQLAELESRPR